MRIEEVIGIFEEKKHDYLRKLTPDKEPIGILLGGQGAVGKGQLNRWAKMLYPSKQFLIVNGDIYRTRHPNFKELRKDIWNYSKETQIFSNVFTERLIAEAIGQQFQCCGGRHNALIISADADRREISFKRLSNSGFRHCCLQRVFAFECFCPLFQGSASQGLRAYD